MSQRKRNKVKPQKEVQGAMVKRTMDQLHDSLLPGIRNELTLREIASRLPLSAWKAAAAVNLDWKRAFHGGMVCHTRAVSQRIETFVVVSCDFVRKSDPNWVERRVLSVFSPNENHWYNLPSIPGVPRFPTGIPFNSQCQYAFVHSSIYLLGGSMSGNDIPSAAVFVLDLAAHPFAWRRCANMQIPRRNFNVGVMHGKIFVFGGKYYDGVFELSNEAYDPKVDAWSWIAPLIPSVSADTVYSVRHVYTVGERFVCCARMPDNSSGWMDVTQGLGGRSDETTPDYGRRLMLTTRTGDDYQIDRLHNIIETSFFKGVGRLPSRSRRLTPATYLACDIQKHEQQRRVPYLWTYDPVEDEWRDFQSGSLGTNDVEWALPKTAGLIQIDFDQMPVRREPPVWTTMWTMHF